jgi:hypothetical protein
MDNPESPTGDAQRNTKSPPSDGVIQQHHDDAAHTEPQAQNSRYHFRNPIKTLWRWTKAEWSKTEFHQRVNIILTLILALATIVYVAFSGLTLRAIRVSSEAAGRQTDKLIIAANTQADAAKEMTKAVKDQATYAGDFAGSAQSINEETKLAVDKFGRMAKASEDNIRAIQESSRSDQRAWLGVADPVFTLNDTSPMKAEAQVSNVGKTPAIEVFSDTAGVQKPKGNGIELGDIVYPHEAISAGTIFPAQRLPVKAQTSPEGDVVLPDQPLIIRFVRRNRG